MYQVGLKTDNFKWLNVKEFGNLLKEFTSRESAEEYISKKPKFLRSKLHIACK